MNTHYCPGCDKEVQEQENKACSEECQSFIDRVMNSTPAALKVGQVMNFDGKALKGFAVIPVCFDLVSTASVVSFWPELHLWTLKVKKSVDLPLYVMSNQERMRLVTQMKKIDPGWKPRSGLITITNSSLKACCKF